jgi:hypothetical protein
MLLQSSKSCRTGAVVFNIRIMGSPVVDMIPCLIQGNRPFVFELLLANLAFRGHHSSGDIPVDGLISMLYLLPGQCSLGACSKRAWTHNSTL